MGRASRRKRERRFDGTPPPQRPLQPPSTRRRLSDEQLAEARAAFAEREAEGAVVYERVCESGGQETFGALGAWGLKLTKRQKERARDYAKTIGPFVCGTCDPAANIEWSLAVLEHAKA